MLKNIYLRFRCKVQSAFGRYLVSDVAALQSLSAIGAGYLPWSGASLTPTAASKVANEIIVNRRRNVLELGSGVSTLLFGKLLHDLGGRLVSVDHDAEWLNRVKEIARNRGIDTSIDFVHAPLRCHPKAMNSQQWYDQEAILQALNGKVDVLIVDGPIGGHRYIMSRYPALPVLRQILADDATVFLDDIDRPEEQKIAALWAREFGLEFDLDKGTLGLLNGNIAIGSFSSRTYTP